MALIGDAAFIYTDPRNGQEVVHRLNAPLSGLTPRHDQWRSVRTSLDRSVTQVVTIGDGVHELVGRIRYDDMPDALLEMLIIAANGAEVTYVPDLSRQTSYTARIIPDGYVVGIAPDADRWMLGEYEATIVLRRKQSFAGLLGRTEGLLIDWEAGQSWADAHFTNSTGGMARGRDGAWRETGPNVPRTTWGTDPVTGLLVPRYLTEPGGTNLMEYSEPTVAQLSTSGGSADAGPSHGFANWLHLPAPVDAPVFAYGRASLDEGVTYTVSIFVRTHDSAPPTNRFTFRRRDGANIGSPTELREEAPGVYRCSRTFVAPAAQTATHLGIYRLPGQGDGPIWATGIQIESTEYLSSYIRTTGAPVARDRDTLYVDLPAEIATPGAPMATYARWVHGMAGGGGLSSPVVWHIGGTGTPWLSAWVTSSGNIALQHRTSSTVYRQVLGPSLQIGDLVESLTLIWTEIIDGRRMLVGRLIARILPAGSSQWGPIESADLPPLEPAPEWSAPRLYVGSRGAAPGVYEFEALKLYAGRLSGTPDELMAFMRRARR